jgi:hypothetical protein
MCGLPVIVELSAVLLAEAASYVEAALQVQPKSVGAVRSQMDKEKAAGQGGQVVGER